ncbi:hypothetical protein EYR01_03420 [Xanthomonas oryzae pv. oryzae]|nr:hypothetical protein EYR02_11100 [Xanthomonas oryzae pv. oryzae]TAP11867.1 hypothetical protein EYR04_11505 [Xanthomonas oryzae pv. oryzae]TAP23849.1 hypothetical protein EYR01_03420 [Xanthomonas oryzae pv. oryzae]
MMVLQAEQPATGGGVIGEMCMDQRCVLQAERGPGSVEPRLQLRCRIGAVEALLVTRDNGCFPDHLHGCTEPLPDKSGAQDVVSCNDVIQCIEKAIAPLFRRKAEHGRMQVRIGKRVAQMMEKQAFLQGRQRLDVLHISRAAVDGGHDGGDLPLRQRDQRQ